MFDNNFFALVTVILLKKHVDAASWPDSVVHEVVSLQEISNITLFIFLQISIQLRVFPLKPSSCANVADVFFRRLEYSSTRSRGPGYFLFVETSRGVLYLLSAIDMTNMYRKTSLDLPIASRSCSSSLQRFSSCSPNGYRRFRNSAETISPNCVVFYCSRDPYDDDSRHSRHSSTCHLTVFLMTAQIEC